MSAVVVRDGQRIEANLRIERRSADTGRLLGVIEVANLVVTDGRNLARDHLGNFGGTGLAQFALGTGSTAPASTDTQLETELLRGPWTAITAPVDGQLDATYYLSSTDGNGSTIAEAGAFANGATATPGSGTLYARATFVGIPKTASEAWTWTWSFYFTSS
ncbi:MAG: hypothetical protein KGL39_17570 [Patescibacteria group bacterium]|nr:hypothetical protein [Patescibacteria group bacterium]